MIKPHKANIYEMVDTINENISRFADILKTSNGAKSPNELSAEVLAYTPDEWQLILLLIAHYNQYGHMLKEHKEDQAEFIKQTQTFIGLMYDLSCCLIDRLAKEVHKA